MFQDVKDLLEAIQKLPPAEHQTAMVTWCIVESIKLIAIALVVWSLGKRILNVITLAFKESNKRDHL